MKRKMKHILIVPAETFPSHEPFLDAVYSKEKDLFKTVFLMKTDKKKYRTAFWNMSKVYLLKRKPRLKIIKYIETYFKIDCRNLIMIPYIIHKEKIDIIQIRDLTFPLVLGLLYKLFFKKKIVYQKSHPHEYLKIHNARRNLHDQKFPNLFYRSVLLENKILHKMLKYADAVFPITPYMAENLQKDYNLPLKKMYPFGMGFDFETSIDQHHSSNHVFRFVYIGTLAKERGFDILLEGIAKFLTKYQNNNVVFDFIGGKEDEIEALKKKAKKLQICNKIKFHGVIPREEVYKLLPQYKIGISWFGSSKRFQCASPTKLMEYLAFQLPCIATDSVSMHQDILDATGAGLITEISPDMICEKLKECVVNYNSLSEKAKNAHYHIKQFHNYQNMKQEIYNIYQTI